MPDSTNEIVSFKTNTLIAEESNPLQKVISLIEKSNVSFKQNDLKTTLTYLNEAWLFFQANPLIYTPELNALILFRYVQIFFKKQDFKKLEYYSELLLEISQKIGDTEKEVTALTNIGITRSVFSDYKTAMPMFVDALEKSRKLGLRSNAANCLINIGTIYANLFNYEEALNRYNTVLEEYQDVLVETTYIAIHLNIGNLHYASEQYKLSLDFFKKALESAENLERKNYVAHAHALMSRTYLALYHLPKAIKSAELSAEYMSQIDNPPGRQINLLNLAQISFLQEDTNASSQMVLKGIAAARRAQDDASELRGFKLFSEILKKEKSYERALRCQMIYSQKQEDYLKMQRNMHILDYEIRYALRDKERKIEELTKEIRYQTLLIDRNSQIEKQNEQLRQANEELQQFAYITSHDLKEPLRMIGSYSQIVQKIFAQQLDDDSRLYFKFINDGATRMNGLLDALLQYATIGKADLELEPVQVADIITIARSNLKLKIEETDTNILCGEMPTVKAIPSFLVQLFQNLIGNAIKFRQEDNRPIILINAEERTNDWLFSVKDNGIGIADEHKERIFVIFQRLHHRNKYEGTGIGLSICNKIVTQLGGKLWVESEPGRGSTFLFTIPK
jgi:signal transduction histidine kinase